MALTIIRIRSVGLPDIQGDAEAISRFIKERITPIPQFVLTPFQEDGKDMLALKIPAGDLYTLLL